MDSKVIEQPTKVVEAQQVLASPDLLEEMALADVLPGMNIQQAPPEPEKCIVGDETLLTLYGEILDNCRDDRKKIDELMVSFVDMVLNDGDGSSASKEAVVNLIKIKADTADKMAKVADLMTRIKLKERDTYKPYLNAHQHNEITIEGSKRDIIKSIEMAKRKKQ